MKNPPGLDDVTRNVPNMRNVPSTRYVPGDMRYVHQATEPCKVDNSDRMIERATKFLDTATKNKEPKQQYLNRDQFLPASAFYAGLTRGNYTIVSPLTNM